MGFHLLPREEKFFDLFDDFTTILTRTANLFLEMVENFDQLKDRTAKLRWEEHSGDEVIEKIIKALDRTFITPFDREDIHTLATSLDDILDNIEETAHRLETFRIGRPTEAAISLVRIVRECCMHIEEAVKLCRTMKNVDQIHRHIREISQLENKADLIYRETDSRLFADPPEILEIIKWRELYGWLEETVDACKDVANTISEIVIKGS
jgi:predicted phosphate transport protein (TIGR00153 family)